jgi:hypothetical protein
MLSSARVIGRFPELMELFLKREVTTTTLSRVSGIITEENKREVILRMTGATCREVEELVADYRPAIPLKEHVKPVRVVRKPKRAAPLPKGGESRPLLGDGKKAPEVEDRIEFKFSLPKEALEKFDELKALLSGKFPLGVSVAEVFDEALSIAVKKLSPKRRLERKAKRGVAPLAIKVNSPKVLKSRYVPRPIRDTVYVRDGGCCTYVSADGKRCGSKHRVQYHHRDAYARGGTNDAENISLMCATHNMLLAEQEFGRAHMQKFKRRGRG